MASNLPYIVSNACGCAIDLIANNVTGWTYDPLNINSLTHLMHVFESQPPAERKEMISTACTVLNAFSLESFARGFLDAPACAYHGPSYSNLSVWTASLLTL